MSLATTVGGANAEPVIDNDSLFAAGYLDGDGDPRLLAHLLQEVLPCEGGDRWDHDDSLHVSRAQFSRGSWATAAAATGYRDPRNPYHVGYNVAWWLGALEREGRSPGSSAGWPSCWWTGVVP